MFIKTSTSMGTLQGCNHCLETQSSIVIPETTYNVGQYGTANKKLKFIGNPFNPILNRLKEEYKSFPKAANKNKMAEKFPQLLVKDNNTQEDKHKFLSCCLIGTFNDPFGLNPNSRL